MATIHNHGKMFALYTPTGELVAVFAYRKGAEHVAALLGFTIPPRTRSENGTRRTY